ncbi:MAG TPA: hypothetical protein VFC44_22215 [Candidatus Saccharimonadales bacterium]|nr:hypothetical protein [Candidatus Saccharimonadales bacterium]
MKYTCLLSAIVVFGLAANAAERTLLLVDDADILYRSGTKRVLCPLTRSPANPLLKSGVYPWEQAIAWMSVYRNPVTAEYQLWYQAYAGNAAHDKTRRCVVAYAESDDGVKFTRPNLGLFDFNGIKENSIVLVANGGSSDRYGASVVVDPRDPDASRRYKMAYSDFSRDSKGQEYPGLHVAFSPDGIHWTKYPHGPLSRTSRGSLGSPLPFQNDTNRPWAIPLSMADANDVFYDPLRQRFVNYAKMWIDGPDGNMYWKHAMGRIESADFIHWSKPQLILTPDDLDPPWVEFHTTPVFYYDDCYFAAIQILDRATRGGVVDVELATSRDGFHWERPFRHPFWLPRAPGHAFDSGSVFLAAQPIVIGSEIRFYYGAYSSGATSGDNYTFASGIGLATMRRDRFAGLQPLARSDQATLKHPLENVGQVTLKPIALDPSSSIELNADASAGEIRVEILGNDGKRVRDFSEDDAVPIHGDSLTHAVQWKSGGLSGLPAENYILRVHLTNATLYAVTVKDGH